MVNSVHNPHPPESLAGQDKPPLSGVGAPPSDTDVERDALHITRALQTTLDVPVLLERFHEQIHQLVQVDGIEYRNPERDISLRFGQRARNTCAYDLQLEGQSLGQVLFRRRRRFTDDQLKALEQLLCSLLYPLRNALLYQDALRAARKDPLTGVWNRAAMDEALQRALCLARRHRSALSILMIDLDHFKRINDRFGHGCGDQALRSVVSCMRNCIRGSDELFRYGGEEFVLLLPNTDKRGALLLADRIRRRIAGGRHVCEDSDMQLTVSIGVTAMKRGDTPETVFERADRAMYRAKEDGRNKVASA